MLISITAKITGQERDTVTATLYDTENADLTRIGEVSLVMSEQGMPTTAGMPDPTAWASSGVLTWASDLEDEDGDTIELRHVADAVCEAVVEALREAASEQDRQDRRRA